MEQVEPLLPRQLRQLAKQSPYGWSMRQPHDSNVRPGEARRELQQRRRLIEKQDEVAFRRDFNDTRKEFETMSARSLIDSVNNM
jgi:hypothetical protein